MQFPPFGRSFIESPRAAGADIGGLSPVSRRKLLALLTLTLLTIVAAIVTGLATPRTFGDLSGTGFTRPILALEFVPSADAFTHIVGNSAAAFRAATLADVVFILAYGVLWAAMLFVASGQKRAFIRRIGLLCLAVAVAADLVENWGILVGLRGESAPAAIIATAAAVKWLALGFAWLTLVERILVTDCGDAKVLKRCASIAATGYLVAGLIALAGTTLVLWRTSGLVLEFVLWPLLVALPVQAGLLGWAAWTKGPDPVPPPEPREHPVFTNTIDAVRRKELEYIARRRWENAHGPEPTCTDVSNTLVGLALSGGGIRSATTNLGMLQALARMGILPKVDYLSTVSGGGYIGACLTSLLSFRRGVFADDAPPGAPQPPPHPYGYGQRHNLRFTTEWRQFPFNPDQPRTTDPCCEPQSPDSIGKRIVAHLRTHGNFLIARSGLLKRDALRAVGHLLTGMVYHLVATIAALFVAALVMMGLAHQLEPDLKTALQIETPSGSTEIANVAPASGAGERYRVSRPERPSIADAIWLRLKGVALDVFSHALEGPLLRSLATGAGASLLVFAIFMVAASLPPWPSRWKPGENQEDAFHRVLLRIGMFALIAAACSCAFIARVETDRHAGSLAAPFLILMAARVTGFVLYVVVTRAETKNPSWQIFNLWTREFRSLWGSFQAMTTYGMVITAVFVLLPILAYASVEVSPWNAVTPAITLVLSRLLVSQPAVSGARRLRVPRSVVRAILGLLVGVSVVVGLVVFAAVAVHFSFDDPQRGIPFVSALLAGLALLLVLGLFGDVNRISPHYFYRDRLLETYLRIETPRADKSMETFCDASAIELRELHGEDPPVPRPGNTAPYMLISAAINLPGSRDLTRKDRKSGYFLFSKYYCGSRHTGYRATEMWRDGDTKLSRAMTISGAAVSTAMGSNTFFAESFVLAVFNVRLGYWMANPRFETSDSFVFWPKYLLQEVFGKANERASLVNLSDGGHTGDNVGIYPLLERRCQVIIACDAEADAGLSFGSFTEALRHAYVDLGITVDINLSLIRPDPVTGLSRSHCAVGRVKYPECPDRPNWLVYLKNSLTGDEPAPVTNYRASNPAFPHESTVDQFFDDAQFESYRALGVHIAEDALASWAADPQVALALGTPQA